MKLKTLWKILKPLIEKVKAEGDAVSSMRLSMQYSPQFDDHLMHVRGESHLVKVLVRGVLEHEGWFKEDDAPLSVYAGVWPLDEVLNAKTRALEESPEAEISAGRDRVLKMGKYGVKSLSTPDES